MDGGQDLKSGLYPPVNYPFYLDCHRLKDIIIIVFDWGGAKAMVERLFFQCASEINSFCRRKKMRRRFFQTNPAVKQIATLMFFCCLLLSTGCATVMTGKFQSVPVTSEPSGVKVKAETGETITTPGKLNLIRNEEHTLMAECPGYEPQHLKLHNKAQGWVWVNILWWPGLIVDCASGASDELIPKEVHFDFANPQLTTREAVKAEKTVAKNTEKTPAPNSSKVLAQTEPNMPASSNIKVLHCGNCSREISKHETAYVCKGNIVCPECYAKLKN
jgi:hypothetical protein